MFIFRFLFSILKYVSSLGIFFCVFIVGHFLFDLIKSVFSKKKYPSVFYKKKYSFNDFCEDVKDEVDNIAGSFTKVFVIITLIGAIISDPTIHQLVGVHNLELKPEGTYCFYVEAFSYSAGKTYYLPAQISITKEKKEDVNDDRGSGIIAHYSYYYFIERVYFSNGGYLDTEGLGPVKIGESTCFYTDEDNEWDITLTNTHAYSPYVKETNNASWFDIAFTSIKIGPVVFALFVLFRKQSSNEQQG